MEEDKLTMTTNVNKFSGADCNVYLTDEPYLDAKTKTPLGQAVAVSWSKEGLNRWAKASGSIFMLVLDKFFDTDIRHKYLTIVCVNEYGKTAMQSFHIQDIISISSGVAVDHMCLEEHIMWEGQVAPLRWSEEEE